MTENKESSEEQIDILIVEDSPTQAEELRYLMEKHRYRVTVAENGRQALELLEKHKPQLVITDIVMPEMDGYELCRQIKANGDTEHIPVILLTSLSDSTDVLEGLSCGADNFITKPYSENYLFPCIEQILANRKMICRERVRVGVEIMFAGKRRFITADQQQMLSLLLSTYEAAVNRNSELIQAQNELKLLNESLENKVSERTAALSAEITERKRAEDEISHVALEWQATFDATYDAIWILDKNQRILRSNSIAEQFFHRPVSELIGKNCREIVHGTTQPIPECPIHRAQQSLHREALELQRGERWIEITVDPILDEDGRYAGAVHIVSDITERRQAGEVLSFLAQYNATFENRNFFESLASYLAESLGMDFVCIDILEEDGLNARTLAVWCDGKFEDNVTYALKDTPCGEVVGKEVCCFPASVCQFFPKDEVLKDLRAEGYVGVTLWSHSGKPNGLIAVIGRRPLVNRAMAEATMRTVAVRAGAEIDRLAAETALRQSEDQLRQSQKMEAVGRLAGGIAHDFNNMLTVINNYAEFALTGLREGDPLRSDIEEILKAGERSAVLTHQLLAFSRRQALEPEVLDMNKIVTSIEPMLRRLIGEDIDFVVHAAEGLGNVKADPGQIEQVIMNLVVNSRDAMPKGGKLTIDTSNVELDDEYTAQHPEVIAGQYIMLSVTDTGCGIDNKAREHIFEPFFTTKELGKGTGLGLSTVFGIVKQSGGHIWVYSEPGEGTTFKIYLPRDLSEIEPVTRATKKSKPATGTETILVVEDEPGVRNLVKRVLVASGYTVHTAANGGEALLTCEREGDSIHLIVTDIVMPEMSGRELAERLVRNCPKMKVLYMSGYTKDAIVHHGILDQRVNFISKPFSLPALTQKVRDVLDG